MPEPLLTNSQRGKKYSRLFRRVLHILSNISRAFLASLFGVFINYVLVRYKASGILTNYVYCISVVNLFFVFANWGGKDYVTKAYAKEPFATKEVTARLLGSKFLFSMLLIPFILVLPVNLAGKLFIAAYLLLKTLGQVYEALVVTQKKYHISLATDLLLNAALLLVIYNDGNTNNPSVFLMQVLTMELLRCLFYALLFRAETSVSLNISGGIQVLKNSRLFFYISLAGFVCSKADLYVTGVLLGKQSMGVYFIITNLVSFCLVAYASIYGTFVSGILRYNQNVFNKFVRSSVYTGIMFSALSALAVYMLCTYLYHHSMSFWFSLLVAANVFGFTRVLMQMYRYTRGERQDLVLRCLLISGIVNCLLSFLLTGPLGHEGAFAANTLAVYVNLALLKREFRIVAS